MGNRNHPHSSMLLLQLFGTICRNTRVPMSVKVAVTNWRHSCLHRPTSYRRLWECSFTKVLWEWLACVLVACFTWQFYDIMLMMLLLMLLLMLMLVYVGCQYLHYIGLGVQPRKTDGGSRLDRDQLPHIINPVEAYLGQTAFILLYLLAFC